MLSSILDPDTTNTALSHLKTSSRRELLSRFNGDNIELSYLLKQAEQVLSPGEVIVLNTIEPGSYLRSHGTELKSILQYINQPNKVRLEGSAIDLCKQLNRNWVTRIHDLGVDHESEITLTRRLGTRRLVIFTASWSFYVSPGILANHIAEPFLNKGVEVRGIQHREVERERIPERMRGSVDGLSSIHEVWGGGYKDDLILHIDNLFQVTRERLFDCVPGKERLGYFYHEQWKAAPWVVETIQQKFSRVYFVSTFCARSYDSTGKNVAGVIPHGYDPKVFYSPFKYKKRDRDFFFVTHSQQQARKGTHELLRAFTEEFGDTREPVHLIIKDIQNSYSSYVEQAKKCSKIVWISENWTSTQLGNMLRLGDCFVFPTRGEGFGIPLLEAQMSGIPIITSNFGGQSDFCHEDDTYFCPYNIMVKDEDYLEATKGPDVWGVASIPALRKLMRYVYEHPEESRRRAALAYQRNKWMTWDNVLEPFVSEIIAKYFDT